MVPLVNLIVVMAAEVKPVTMLCLVLLSATASVVGMVVTSAYCRWPGCKMYHIMHHVRHDQAEIDSGAGQYRVMRIRLGS